MHINSLVNLFPYTSPLLLSSEIQSIACFHVSASISDNIFLIQYLIFFFTFSIINMYSAVPLSPKKLLIIFKILIKLIIGRIREEVFK